MCDFMAPNGGTLREREERAPGLREVVPRRMEELTFVYTVQIEGMNAYQINWKGESMPTPEQILENREDLADEKIKILDSEGRPMPGVEITREDFFSALERAVAQGKKVTIA